MSSTEQNKTVVRRFHEAFDRGDMPTMDNLLEANLVVYQPGVPFPLDKAAFKQMGEMFLSAFSQSQTVIEHLVAEGDWVGGFGTWSAVQEGEFQGIPATGKAVKVNVIYFDRILNGKIVEHRALFDVPVMMQQLGVAPMPAQG